MCSHSNKINSRNQSIDQRMIYTFSWFFTNNPLSRPRLRTKERCAWWRSLCWFTTEKTSWATETRTEWCRCQHLSKWAGCRCRDCGGHGWWSRTKQGRWLYWSASKATKRSIMQHIWRRWITSRGFSNLSSAKSRWRCCDLKARGMGRSWFR